ncbi:MAG: CRISPR-associated endonuclease Cas2 [Solobacterium sp.]|nr:CRISPR-associated endonuclease Cas2 [Solobacterium sp.]MDD7776840.1 CRISPR-associated endonuclease Cas2 [Solobacterium sp.]MDY2953847.1 CRISPR-associated endonuclease Cas2 [Erysipelotrichaceae bacterium]
MRVLVFFDLPMLSSEDRKAYTRFRKFLINDGYMMLQESVYCKLAMNQNAANALILRLKQNKPSAGLVQALVITEKQFANIELIIGDKSNDIIDTSERMVVL